MKKRLFSFKYKNLVADNMFKMGFIYLQVK